MVRLPRDLVSDRLIDDLVNVYIKLLSDEFETLVKRGNTERLHTASSCYSLIATLRKSQRKLGDKAKVNLPKLAEALDASTSGRSRKPNQNMR